MKYIGCLAYLCANPRAIDDISDSGSPENRIIQKNLFIMVILIS